MKVVNIKYRKLFKLRKQFCHAFSRNLENLLKQAGISLSNIIDIINKVVSHCKCANSIKNQFLDQQ